MNIFLVFIITIFLPLSLSFANQWQIDQKMKFNFTYLPSDISERESTQASKPLLKNRPVWEPDIANINYDGLLGLGFPIPAMKDSSKLRFLLKIYEFPKTLNAHVSAHRTLDRFLIHSLRGGEKIYKFIQNSDHLAVKFAVVDNQKNVYSESSPLPSFQLSKDGITKQSEFDSSIPFTSLYLTTNAKSAKNIAGVLAFHLDLLEAYREILIELPSDKDKYYFAMMSRCFQNINKVCSLTIYEVPKEPMKFENFQDLPMPQDPQRIFLSGLLLIKVTEYAVQNTSYDPIKLKTQTLDKSNLRPIFSQIMEIGSVISKF